jgi:peptidoglycan/LPS O-acetylase OafA/YrhL
MLYVGFFVVPIGLILLGVSMLGAPAFGKGFGGVSVVLGVVGLVAAVLQMVAPSSMIGALSYSAFLIFYLVLGWKVYSLSRTPQGVLKIGD